MLYENVIMGLMLLMCVAAILVFAGFGVEAIRMKDKILAFASFLGCISMLVLSLTFLEYFGIVQLGILH